MGKEAAAKVPENGPKRKLLGFAVADDEAIIYGGSPVEG